MRNLPNFYSWSLRAKLVSIIMLSSVVCLLISLSVLAVSSASSRYQDSIDQLSGLANVLAENGQAALVFSDHTEAQRLLDSLESHRDISSAILVNEKGVVLASWSRKGEKIEAPANYRGQGMQLHSNFWSSHAEFYLPVIKASEQIGYVLLKADFTERWERLFEDVGEGLGAGGLALLVALVMSLRLQRLISRPLAEIAVTARTIAHDKIYGLRVPHRTHDEIGDLVNALNEMLEEIQVRDEHLSHHRSILAEEVEKRTKELRTILENTPDIIVRYDLGFRRIYVNPAFKVLTENPEATLLGNDPSGFMDASSFTLFKDSFNSVLATGRNARIELKLKNLDGKEIYHHIRLIAERDSSGKIASVLGVGRDITELKEYQAELQRKELAKTRFLAAAGHDMRQPLAAANLFIDALKYTGPTANQNQIIQRLEQTMSNFNNLLDALLNVSKLDAGMIKPEYRSVSVPELFYWLEQNLAPLVDEKRIKLKFHSLKESALVVRSDIGLIQSILMNLVSNAIKFTHEGGILVSARLRGNEVLFQVWDTGLGIESEYIEKIFDEFYQINNQHRDGARGLGLGLSIVKRALSLMDRVIVCRSQIGRGSVFEFSLPLDAEFNESDLQNNNENHDDGVDQATFVHEKKFVVVEDNALVAEAVDKILTEMGAEVKLFPSAEDALSYANIEDADYFIVDFMLGGKINGIQFLNLLRQKLGKPVIGVITTGDTSPTLVREAANCDWPVLHKPVSISKLIASIRAQTE